jgi:hypothetical protein
MVLTGETGAPGERPVCPSVTPPTTQPPWADLELNSSLRGERLPFCVYRLTAVPDALCMVLAGNPDMNNNSLHHSCRTVFCALLSSHAAPPSPLTATLSSRNWPCHSEDGYGPISHCRGLGSLPGQSMLRLLWAKCHCDKCCFLYFSFPLSVSISPPVLQTDVSYIL